MKIINRKKWIISLFLTLGLVVCLTHPVVGQAEDYTIHVRKDFGYGLGSDIQGKFTLSLVGDEESVEGVTFLIDDEAIATVQEPPFRYQFQTDDYEPGEHELSAEVQLKNGSVQVTPVVNFHFVSSDMANQQLTTILLWIGGAIGAAMVLVVVIQTVFFKPKGTKPGQTGKKSHYGFLGATICPKCGRPFSRHIWGINLMVGRLDRCELCGKWVMTRRALPSELQAAEVAEQEESQGEQVISRDQWDEDTLLDETRFIDER